ncbi:MAG TPA: GFA family protein [Candidatus Udaeobacter sp.]|nr:GFA family protein [Candidatus Udaeobacter sp.]
METESKTIRGGCLCGAIRYAGVGEPYNVTHCHCQDCRKSTGAPVVTWASFRRGNFQFTKGKPREIAWGGRVRSFCPTCGSALTFMSEPDTNEIDVTVATFDRPEIVTPADHIWTEDRISWIKLADNLPQHAQRRTK